MKEIIWALAAGAAVGLCACATTSTAEHAPDQVGSSAVNSATSATSGAINSSVGSATSGFWHRVFGGH